MTGDETASGGDSESQPSDEDIVEGLVGTETRSPDVDDIVNRMVGYEDFSNPRDDSRKIDL